MLIFNCLLILIQQARNPRSYASQIYDPLTDSLTGVKCRATSVAKKFQVKNFHCKHSPPDIHDCCSWQEDKCLSGELSDEFLSKECFSTWYSWLLHLTRRWMFFSGELSDELLSQECFSKENPPDIHDCCTWQEVECLSDEGGGTVLLKPCTDKSVDIILNG